MAAVEQGPEAQQRQQEREQSKEQSLFGSEIRASAVRSVIGRRRRGIGDAPRRKWCGDQVPIPK